jgi:RNA polymerase sigma-70 factor (ECF subfamily)
MIGAKPLRNLNPTQVVANISAAEGYKALWDDESVLVERAKRGDEAAFAAIYDRYEKQIYGLIYRLMGNSEDAFDLTQDVFIKAYKGLDKTQPELNLGAWLHRIASNACLDVLRRRKIVRWLPWDPAVHANITPGDEFDEPEQHIVRRETTEQVQAVLNKLSPKYRLCLVLREYQDLSCEEIGEIMNLSRAAVKSTLFRAREQFREVYEEFQNQNWAGVNSTGKTGTAFSSNIPTTPSKTTGKKGGKR